MSAADAAAPERGPGPLARLGAWLEARRLVRYAWDNPSAEADARSILTSPKVSMWLGLEVLLVLLVAGGVLLIGPTEDRDFAGLLEQNGAGAVLIDATFATITLFFGLVLPFRASGLLEGPRWRGYLDQVITTGVSPLRYYAGKWAASQPFIAALLLATLPFVTLFGLLGGADWGRVLVGYLLLFCYGNLLIAVACGLGALVHEGLAVLLTLSIFGLAEFGSLVFVPSSLGSFTPLRYFVQPAVSSLGGPQGALLEQLYGAPVILGVTLPWLPWTLGLWAAIGACMALTCALGPLHTFVPGLNNFGALVFTGDKGRFRFRKLRPFLTRRTELAFLFDNRPPRLGRWVLPLRALQLGFFLFLVPLLLFSAAFGHPFLKHIPMEGMFAIEISGVVIALALAALLLVTARGQSLARFRLGDLVIPQVAFDLGLFLLFLAWIAALHVLGFAVAWEDLAAPRPFWSRSGNPHDLFRQSSLVLGMTFPLALGVFLVMKTAAARLHGKGVVLLVSIVYGIVIVTAPLIFIPLSQACADADNPALHPWATPLYALTQASPVAAAKSLLDGSPRWVRDQHWLLSKGYWLWQALWVSYLSVLLWRTHSVAMQEAEVFAAIDPQGDARAAGKQPCPKCGSLLQAPLAFSGWTGVVLTRLLRDVRCLDCEQEFHGPSGEVRKHRQLALGLAGLLGVTGGAWALTLLLLRLT
ncbi:MAG: ABC transporter permease [Planctomycetota bacterium]